MFNSQGALLDSFMYWRGPLNRIKPINNIKSNEVDEEDEHVMYLSNKVDFHLENEQKYHSSVTNPKNQGIVFDSCYPNLVHSSKHQSYDFYTSSLDLGINQVNQRDNSNDQQDSYTPKVNLQKAPSYKVIVNPYNGHKSYQENKENDTKLHNSSNSFVLSTANEILEQKIRFDTQEEKKYDGLTHKRLSQDMYAFSPQKCINIEIPEFFSTSDSGSKDYSSEAAKFNKRINF